MNLPTELMSGLAWFPLLAELAIKATIVLLLTAAAAALLRGFSAAVRHLVWCVGIAGVLALPLFSVLVPAWDLPLLPAAAVTTSPAAYPPPVEGQVVGTVLPPAPAMPAEAVFSEAAPLAGGVWFTPVLAAVMIGGVMLGLLWLAAGFWGAARIGRRAQVVRDPRWLRVAQEISGRLGLRRPVLLLQSRGAAMPATWGLLWPSVVLPATADQWSEERRRAVLAHELAHVKRFDCLTQTLAHLTCVLFWWHPAVWYAARRLRVERESACDDLVLLAGTRPSDYAMHLLEIARAYRAQRLAAPALVSMAKPSQLESRLLSVLDETRPRSTPSLRAAVLAVLVGIGLVGPLAAMRPGERTAGIDLDEAAAAAAHGVPAASPALRHDAAPYAAGITRSGTVVDLPLEPRVVPVDTPSPGVRRAAGEDQLTVEQLIERRIHRVTPEFVRGLEALGYPGLTHEQLVEMRIHRVTPEFIRGLEALGYRGLTTRELVEARIHRVTPEFIREMEAAGYRNLSVRQLVTFRIHGVTAEYVREMEALGYRDLSPERLVEMRIHRVTPEYVREMEALGYRGLTPRELVEARIHRVTPEFIGQMRDLGLGDLSLETLVRLRISGVARDLIESRHRTSMPNGR